MSPFPSILESGDPNRYSAQELSHGDHRLVGASLPRLQHTGANLEGLQWIRTRFDRLQLAASRVTGGLLSESRAGDVELHGVDFRFVHFKKVRFDRLSLRQVNFVQCSFEECHFEPVMEPAEGDGVHFDQCHFVDPEERFFPFLKGRAWSFSRCTFVAPRSLEGLDEANLFLPLLAIPATSTPLAPTPASAPAPVVNVPRMAMPQPPETAPPPVVKESAPKNRFDHLELG